MTSFKLPISLVRQFMFCQRAAWHYCWLTVMPPQPDWVKSGSLFHENQKKNFVRRIGSNFKNSQMKFNVRLDHEEFDFYGVVDGLYINENTIDIIEFKSSKFGRKSAIIQSCLYGLLSEKIYNKRFDRIYLYLGTKSKPDCIIVT